MDKEIESDSREVWGVYGNMFVDLIGLIYAPHLFFKL